MKEASNIVLYGDSIPYEYVSILRKYLNKRIKSFSGTITNMGVIGETSFDALKRLDQVERQQCNIAVVHMGMNDWRKGVSIKEFKGNVTRIVQRLHTFDRRVILSSITPDWNGKEFPLSQEGRVGNSPEIDEYNRVLEEIACEEKVRLADTNGLWKQYLSPQWVGLKDAIHPNRLGQEVICEALYYMISRDHVTIVWPFNGIYAKCGYKCPYCYVPASVNENIGVQYSIEEWEKGFLLSFGEKQRLTFYLSYGEPTMAPQFISLLEMVGKRPKWDVIITSNLSTNVKRFNNTQLVKDGRLNINASFHPTETTREKFLNKLLALREMGIESPVVYVAYPPLLSRIEDDISYFEKHNYVVHVRRFRGRYKGKFYPDSYNEDERQLIARYMDMGSIRYMLSNVSSLGRRTFLGMHHIMANENGDVELCDEYPGERNLGNIIRGDVKLYNLPQPFPGPVSLGAVDDVANIVELGYDELDGNHVLSFAEQGGVYKNSNRVIYPYRNTTFDKAMWKKLFEVPKPEKVRTPSWYLKHRIWIYGIERNYNRGKEFLRGKWRLLKKGRLSLRDFYHS